MCYKEGEVPVHVIREHGGNGGTAPFLTSALDGRQWASRRGRSTVVLTECRLNPGAGLEGVGKEKISLLKHPYQRDEREQSKTLHQPHVFFCCFLFLFIFLTLRSGTGTGLSPGSWVVCASIFPKMLHTHTPPTSKLFVSEGQAGLAWRFSNNVMSLLPPTYIKSTSLLEGYEVWSARHSDMSNRKVKKVVRISGLQ
jgi:hypothetical protein